jgi:hypothetical protein
MMRAPVNAYEGAAPPDRPPFDAARLEGSARSVYASLKSVESWVERHNYMAYEPFDGLSSPLHRITRRHLLLDRLLLQAIRQSPLNLRPLLGVKPLPSTKGRGYMAAGYITMYQVTKDATYRDKAISNLDWLIAHKSAGYKDYAWANHFPFASRGGTYPAHEPIIVWTALVGYAFVDAFEVFGESRFLDVARSICRWILSLPRERTSTGTCLSYHHLYQESIHNANMLGAAMLARTWKHSGDGEYLEAAAEAMRYSCTRQLPDGAWWYAEEDKYHWIDNFHTGYNLDSLRYYIDSTGDNTHREVMLRGLDFYTRNFFRGDGCPRYYHSRTQPIDSQCAAQSIETLARFADLDPAVLPLAERVAQWTIRNMQSRDGHFVYRVYPLVKARAPMLHWAQATTFRGLTLLLQRQLGQRP